MPGEKPRAVLQFNEYDFRHRKVLEILRERPRNKTELVVNAIPVSYTHLTLPTTPYV